MHLFPQRTVSRCLRRPGTVATLLVSALATTTFGLAVGPGEAGASGVANPTSLLAAAKAAIAKQGAVHLVVNSKSASSSAIETVVADLGRKSGVEAISDGAGSVTILVTPAYGYISGNSSGLTKIVGLTAAEVKKVGKLWIALKAGSSQYKGLATDITISSIETVLPNPKGPTLSVDTTTATHLYVLKWTTAATSSTPKLSSLLTLPVAGVPLPIQEITTAAGSKETITLSKWGEFVRLDPPPAGSTIPFAKVTG
jgi:hypothetical protein